MFGFLKHGLHATLFGTAEQRCEERTCHVDGRQVHM